MVFLHVYLDDIKISHVVDWKEEYLQYPDCDYVRKYVDYYRRTRKKQRMKWDGKFSFLNLIKLDQRMIILRHSESIHKRFPHVFVSLLIIMVYHLQDHLRLQHLDYIEVNVWQHSIDHVQQPTKLPFYFPILFNKFNGKSVTIDLLNQWYWYPHDFLIK